MTFFGVECNEMNIYFIFTKSVITPCFGHFKCKYTVLCAVKKGLRGSALCAMSCVSLLQDNNTIYCTTGQKCCYNCGKVVISDYGHATSLHYSRSGINFVCHVYVVRCTRNFEQSLFLNFSLSGQYYILLLLLPTLFRKLLSKFSNKQKKKFLVNLVSSFVHKNHK